MTVLVWRRVIRRCWTTLGETTEKIRRLRVALGKRKSPLKAVAGTLRK